MQHQNDPELGVYVIDRFTYHALKFLEKLKADSKHTLADFVSWRHWFIKGLEHVVIENSMRMRGEWERLRYLISVN